MQTPDADLIRPAAVAGRFYTSDPDQLAHEISDYLAEGARHPQTGLQGQPLPPGKVKALICPHAGFIFSGPVAGSAYATVLPQTEEIKRVVLIGPAHRVAVEGLAASSMTAFQTPLGVVRTDPVVVDLCDEGLVHIVDAAHGPEHSIEVQLPFLQQMLGSAFTVVPLLFGQCEPASIAAVIDRLWGGEETLIVVSSDLSHFHPHDRAAVLDHETSAAIEALDPRLGEGSACGRLAILGLLQVAARRGLVCTAVDVRTSADTAGDPQRVVGYGAYVFHDTC